MSENDNNKTVKEALKLVKESASVPSMQKVPQKEGLATSSADVTKFELAPGTAPAKPTKK